MPSVANKQQASERSQTIRHQSLQTSPLKGIGASGRPKKTGSGMRVRVRRGVPRGDSVKQQCDFLAAMESILDKIAAIPLQEIPFEGLALREQMYRSTEWMEASFRGEIKKRNLDHVHIHTRRPSSRMGAQSDSPVS